MRQYVCPACGAANRTPDGKDPLAAKCGRCKQDLFSAHPTEVDAKALRAHRALDQGGGGAGGRLGALVRPVPGDGAEFRGRRRQARA